MGQWETLLFSLVDIVQEMIAEGEQLPDEIIDQLIDTFSFLMEKVQEEKP